MQYVPLQRREKESARGGISIRPGPARLVSSSFLMRRPSGPRLLAARLAGWLAGSTVRTILVRLGHADGAWRQQRACVGTHALAGHALYGLASGQPMERPQEQRRPLHGRRSRQQRREEVEAWRTRGSGMDEVCLFKSVFWETHRRPSGRLVLLPLCPGTSSPFPLPSSSQASPLHSEPHLPNSHACPSTMAEMH